MAPCLSTVQDLDRCLLSNQLKTHPIYEMHYINYEVQRISETIVDYPDLVFPTNKPEYLYYRD